MKSITDRFAMFTLAVCLTVVFVDSLDRQTHHSRAQSINSAQQQEVHTEEDSDQHPPSFEMKIGVTSVWDGMRAISQVVWHEWSWMLVPCLFILTIKRVLLKQSTPEIVACSLEVVAFTMSHAIEIVRYASIYLQKLAKELRQI